MAAGTHPRDPLQPGGSALEDLRDECAMLCALGQLLALLYRQPFDDERIAFFETVDVDDEDDPLMANGFCREGVLLVRGHFASRPHDEAKLSASNDFHKLFVGPNKLWAVPWSSCYIDGRDVFGPTEHAVRAVFNAHGFDIPEGRREPCDHIAYELQFLAELHKRAIEAWGDDASSPSAEAETALMDARSFKDCFIDPWAADFLDRVEKGSRADVYRGVASMTRGFLQMEDAFLPFSERVEEVA